MLIHCMIVEENTFVVIVYRRIRPLPFFNTVQIVPSNSAFNPQQHSIELFNATLTSAGQKNAELIFEKLHLIHKLKFRIFNSMAVISYLSFHM